MEHRILIHVAAAGDAQLAERVLRSADIEARACTSEDELAAELQLGAGALLIAEEALTPPVLAALSQLLAGQAAWSDLPLLVMAKRGADTLEAQRAVERLGNVTMLERPVRTITLVSAARSALRARARQYEMRALSRRKDEFLATLAHELRNPLAPIRNAMAILQRLHPSPQVGSLVGIVDRQVSHLTRLVDDLLDVARITSGKLELQLSRTSARRVAAHALEIAQAGFAARDHEVVLQQPEGEVVLQADHVRLVQAVANLLVNAGKFTPPGGRIRLEIRHDGPAVEFVVQDNGVGLAPTELHRIFDMFEQTRTIGEPTGGLGLGLHLTRAFAQLHGGSVEARSAGAGAGSEFVLRLPVVVEPETTALPPPASPSAPGCTARRILVVDDNVDAANTLEALLTLHGMSVSVAHDGAAAVNRVVVDNPDAVVMDIGMPVMNGYEAARRIRSRSGSPKPLLIALTGWGQYADKARASEAGFDYHLVKPLDFDKLLGCLSRL
ncbi:MAG TPA: response regulator [Ramlibacter sp.]|jgi:signal transduction histidine kinase|uniref:hybrid sensor histidine kinase/response regulator n=1 Tax=Ramlibacter sp. TaxID=1917967 RepID=UPI002D59865A|nr:response regulator [Ramlibacter sp.]HZY18438.1 response regulator [Ramlibacter sp.]